MTLDRLVKLRRGARRKPDRNLGFVGHLTKTGTKLEHVSSSICPLAFQEQACTAICDGIEFLFLPSHCRCGGSPSAKLVVLVCSEQLRRTAGDRTNWIVNIGDHPYGVDIVIPNKYGAQLSADELAKTLRSMVHRSMDFAARSSPIMVSVGRRRGQSAAVSWTEATATTRSTRR